MRRQQASKVSRASEAGIVEQASDAGRASSEALTIDFVSSTCRL